MSRGRVRAKVQDRDIGSAASNDNFERDPWGSGQLRKTALADGTYATAGTHHDRGIDLAERGIQEGRLELLRQARDEFEAALRVVPETDATAAFRRRETINLAIVMRRLGQERETIALLEGICNTLTRDADWLTDGPRALDSLGTAYTRTGDPQRAVAAYREALAVLGRAPGKSRRAHASLHGKILSNLAAAYIDQRQAAPALDAVTAALRLISDAGDPLSLGRTRRIQAEAFQLQAQSYGDRDEWPAAHAALIRATEIFDVARQDVLAQGATADWAETTAALAGAVTNLGELMLRRGAEGDRHAGFQRLWRGIALYEEALGCLTSNSDRKDVQNFLDAVLKLILDLTTDRADAWQCFLAGIETLGAEFLNHKQFIQEIEGRFRFGESIKFGYFEVDPASETADPPPFRMQDDAEITVDELVSFFRTLPKERRTVLGLIGALANEMLADVPLGSFGIAAHARLAAVSIAARRQHAAEPDTAAESRPIESWKTAKASGEGLPDFVARVFAAERAAGTLTTSMLRADKDLYVDYYNWRRKRDLPEAVFWLRDLPNRKHETTRRLEQIGVRSSGEAVSVSAFSPEAQEAIRLYKAANTRASRSKSRVPDA